MAIALGSATLAAAITADALVVGTGGGYARSANFSITGVVLPVAGSAQSDDATSTVTLGRTRVGIAGSRISIRPAIDDAMEPPLGVWLIY